MQAPTGRNSQRWSFVVVTDPARRRALADLWRAGIGQGDSPMSAADMRRAYHDPRSMDRVWTGLDHLKDNLHRVPVLVVPCIEGRTDGLAADRQAGQWGSVLPAVWSFMLAARSRGLGSVWTTLHLANEAQAAELLGIPENMTQVALIPVAHFTGDDFKPAVRPPVEGITYWDSWGATGE